MGICWLRCGCCCKWGAGWSGTGACHSGEDRRLIDRAKALLMDRHGITEEQAHYYLQKKYGQQDKLALTARLVLDSKTME